MSHSIQSGFGGPFGKSPEFSGKSRPEYRLCWRCPIGDFTGVGNDPDTVPLMRGADVGRCNAIPLRVIPALGQLCEDEIETSRPESDDVLHEQVSGSKLAK